MLLLVMIFLLLGSKFSAEQEDDHQQEEDDEDLSEEEEPINHEDLSDEEEPANDEDLIEEEEPTNQEDSKKEEKPTKEEESREEEEHTTEKDSSKEEKPTTEKDSSKEEKPTSEKDSDEEEESTNQEDSDEDEEYTNQEDSDEEEERTNQGDSDEEEERTNQEDSDEEEDRTNLEDSKEKTINRILVPWPSELVYLGKVYSKDEDGRPKRYLCGGTIISLYHLLTTARCLIKEDPTRGDYTKFLVVPGSQDKSNTLPYYTVRDVRIHGYYDPEAKAFDLGVLASNRGFKTEEQAPRHIAFARDSFSYVMDEYQKRREPCFFAGWGTARNPKETKLTMFRLTLMTIEECQKALGKEEGKKLNTRTHLCARGWKSNPVCPFHEGMGLMCWTEGHGKLFVWGVALATDKCGGVDPIASLFTRVDTATKFISSTFTEGSAPRHHRLSAFHLVTIVMMTTL